MPVIEAEKITYLPSGGRECGVTDVSFEAEKGKLTVILGSDNSGKTTLVRMMNALILPQSGKMTVCGMETADKGKLREIRKSCGVIFSELRELFYTGCIADEMRFALTCTGRDRKASQEVCDRAEALCRTAAYKAVPFSQLNEFQQLSGAIAARLVTSPEVLVFDGVTAALTKTDRAVFFRLLGSLTAEGKAVILTTSDAEDVVYADRVILMCKGEKLAERSAWVILTDRELLRKADIEPPFAVRVYYDLLDADARLREIPLTMEELVKEICR